MSKRKGATVPPDEALFASLTDEQRNLFEALRTRLTTANSLAELNAVVNDNFKQDVYSLPEAAQRELRDQFSMNRDAVKHKVKMEAIANKVVVITDPPEFPPASPEFPNSVFCVIKGKVEDTGEIFECVSGAVRVVRHFQESKTESYPQRLEFYRESADAMRARNAKADTTPMWLVRRIAATRDRNKDGIPF